MLIDPIPVPEPLVVVDGLVLSISLLTSRMTSCLSASHLFAASPQSSRELRVSTRERARTRPSLIIL